MKSRFLGAFLTVISLITASTIGALANINPSNAKTLAANSYSYKNLCPSGEESIATKPKLSAETKDFYLNICKSSDNSSYYVGSAKNHNRYIFLPLLREKPGFYSAVNNNYTYALDVNQKYLRVYKGEQLVLQQRIYNVHNF